LAVGSLGIDSNAGNQLIVSMPLDKKRHEMAVTSCVHLSDHSEPDKDNAFADLCKSIKPEDVLVINGDLIEFLSSTIWLIKNLMPFKSTNEELEQITNQILDRVILCHKAAFDALKHVKNKIILVGNHDRFLINFKSLRDKLFAAIGPYKIGLIYEDENLHIEHGDRQDITPEEVKDVFAVQMISGFWYRMKQNLKEIGKEKDFRRLFKILFADIDKVYPRVLLPLYIERLVSQLPLDERKAVIAAWNQSIESILIEPCVEEFLKNKPIWSFLFRQGSKLDSGFASFLRSLAMFGFQFGFLKPDPSEKIADQAIRKIASLSNKKATIIGHYHQDKLEKDKVGKYLIRSGLWVNPIRAVKTIIFDEYFDNLLPHFSYILLTLSDGGLTSARIIRS
jgi:UDP-2,3-diacylglucosamine pyrophosphatase LpxH